ncbi:MAG: diacylglycerol kinase family protein [Bacteriovoracaceae bacterium]
MKRIFVINPTSGKGFNQNSINELQNFFSPLIGPIDYIVSANRDDFILKTQAYLKKGYQEIVAIGGDGTINAAVNGFFENGKLINPDAFLIVSQNGTGSDYYRSITYNKNVTDWRTLVTHFKRKKVDLGLIEINDSKKLYFNNITGIGFSAKVVDDKNRQPKFIPKKLSYIVPTLKNLVSFQAVPLRITIDQAIFDNQFKAIFIAKGKFSGGGIPFGALSELDNGLFDISLILDLDIFEGGTFFNKILLTKDYKFTDFPQAKRVAASSIEIVATTKTHFDIEVDGELFLEVKKVKVSLLPQTITIGFPL